MKRSLVWITVCALAFALAAPRAMAAPPEQAQNQTTAALSAEAQARVDTIQLWITALEQLKATLPAEAHASADAAIAVLVDLKEAEARGKGAGSLKAAQAVLQLQAMVAGFDLEPAVKQALIDAVAEFQADLSVTQTGLEKANAARAAAAARLEARLEAMQNETAKANIAELITKLTTELTGAGEVADEAEALAAIEAAVEAKAKKNATDLDVQAEAELRQGKKAEARATLLTRLEANPHTKTAYEKLLALETEAGTYQDLDTYVRGSKVEFDVRPFLREGRTLVPIRALVEKLGAVVGWDEATQTVTITKGETVIKLMIGSKTAMIGDKSYELEAAAVIENGRTVVPARFVSEGLGLYVKWLAEYRTILVTDEPVADE